MVYPTQDELLAAEPLLEWIDEHFLRPDPYIFRRDGFREILKLIAREWEVDANSVYCIGSGAVGLSLNPSKVVDGRLKAFDGSSDLDLAVISAHHFDLAWRDLRAATQSIFDKTQVAEVVRENIDWQRKKLFDGAILAHRLLSELTFGSVWLPALVRIEAAAVRALDREIEVNVWVWRDYWSLRNYIAHGLTQCKEATKHG